MNKKIFSLLFLTFISLLKVDVFAETVSNEYTFNPNFHPYSETYKETTINVDQGKELVINIQGIRFVSLASCYLWDSPSLEVGELRMYDQTEVPFSLALLNLSDMLISPATSPNTISLHWKRASNLDWVSYHPVRDFYWCFTYNEGFESRSKYIHIHLK